ERVPVPAVDARQPEVGRDLAEAHGLAPTRRVPPYLGGGERRVPQRDERERDEPPAAVAATLLDHPVVVGGHARLGELAVLGLEERLAAEARERRERQRRLGPVEVHVLE